MLKMNGFAGGKDKKDPMFGFHNLFRRFNNFFFFHMREQVK